MPKIGTLVSANPQYAGAERATEGRPYGGKMENLCRIRGPCRHVAQQNVSRETKGARKTIALP
jgi:hypothetical protein